MIHPDRNFLGRFYVFKSFSSPVEKERRKLESIKKLLEKVTARNEGLMEENEKYTKDIASLLHLLGQRDVEIKQAQVVKSKGKDIGTKVLTNVLRKYTYTKAVSKTLNKWKLILLGKTDAE